MFSPDGTDNNWQAVESPVQGHTELIQTISFTAGESLIIRVEDYDQNLDSTVFETIIIDLEISNTGDVERLRLTESATDSGVFVGVLELAESATSDQNNGVLSVEALSEISAKYKDREDQTDTAATVGIVDPSNLVFDSTTGEPINGAIITLVYKGSNQFQFPRVLQGEYELKVTPPVGYRFPSQQSQSHLDQLGDIASQVTQGSRGEEFSIADALGAVLMNLPLDPFEGRFSVQKSANITTAAVGDEVIYSVTAQNNDANYALNNVILKDTLPPGFRYIESSAKNSAGTSLSADSVKVDGRNLTFSLGTLTANASQKISYRVVIGAGSPVGDAVNTVQGFSEDVASNIAKASIEMRDDLMRSKNILIGRVYSGECGNPDKQQAIKNARLYVDNGRTVVTDKHGRWHLEGLRPGTHAIQLDESSLPKGMVASPCKMTSRHVKQTHSRIVNLQQGQLWQVNFHIAPAKGKQIKPQKMANLEKDEYKLPFNPLVQFGTKFAEKTTPGFEFVWPPARHVPALSQVLI